MTIVDRSFLVKGDVIAIHPGAYVKNFLEDEGMSQTEFSKRMGISQEQVIKLINGEVDLTENMIAKLSYVTGTSKEYWRHLNNTYLEKKHRINNYGKLNNKWTDLKMKIYCFQYNEDHGGCDYPTENGVALAHNKEEAWKLFFSKYEGYSLSFKDLKQNYKIVDVIEIDKPVAWCGECTN